MIQHRPPLTPSHPDLAGAPCVREGSEVGCAMSLRLDRPRSQSPHFPGNWPATCRRAQFFGQRGRPPISWLSKGHSESNAPAVSTSPQRQKRRSAQRARAHPTPNPAHSHILALPGETARTYSRIPRARCAHPPPNPILSRTLSNRAEHVPARTTWT